MLSRVAERIYWLGRYMERGENTARLVNVNSNLLLDLPSGVRVGWGSLIDISGTGKYFEHDTEHADEKTVVNFILADKNNPASLINSLSFARENARITREIMPMEAWELVNDLYHYIRDRTEKVTSRRDRGIILLHVISNVQQLTGLLAGCMSHNNAYDLIRIGRNLERADMTTRIVDAGLVNLLPHLSVGGGAEALEPYDNILWMSVLRSLSGYQMYRQHVRDRVNANAVVEFLLQNEDFPRAVGHCLKQLEQCLWGMPNSEKVLAAIVGLQQKIEEADMDALLKQGLHEYIDDVQLDIGNLHYRIAETWFLPMVLAPESAA